MSWLRDLINAWFPLPLCNICGNHQVRVRHSRYCQRCFDEALTLKLPDATWDEYHAGR
jgi:hypothetical protein